MPPLAALLAGLLHAATALAIFWMAPVHRQDLEDNAVEVTFEDAKPPEPVEQAAQQPVPPPPAPAPTPTPAPAPAPSPSPPPAAETKPPPAPPPAEPKAQAKSNQPLGVSPPPPEAKKPDEPKLQPPQEAKLEPQKAAEPKPQPAQEATVEPAKPAESPAQPQQEAAAEAPAPAPSPPPPDKPLEKIVPPVETPPAPLTMRDFVKVLPPRPSQQQHQQQQSHALQRSPLSTGPTPAPQGSSGAVVSTFVNPAIEASQTLAKNAYLLGVLRKFGQYVSNLREKGEGGTVVLRFVIARDGRLVEASIAKSSGVPALDKGMLDALRAAAPYLPLPPEISENQVVFVQPIQASRL